MKHFDIPDINTPEYWNTHQTATDFGLRQEMYWQLIGSPEKVCELGCGLSPFLAGKPDLVIERWGVDFSPETVKSAAELYPNVKYTLADVTDTPFSDQSFDAVVSGEVIEHLKKPMDLIHEMVRLCKTGGTIVISTPHLEFQDPEHLWEFDEEWFWNLGFFTQIKQSDRFPGRAYLFAWRTL